MQGPVCRAGTAVKTASASLKARHKQCRIASKPAVKIPPPQTPLKPAITTSLKPTIQPPTPHPSAPGKVRMIYESPAMITSGTNKDKHCSIISYDTSASAYMAVLTEEPSSGNDGGMLMGAVKFIAPHHLRLEDEILDCMFRRIPSQLDFRRTFAMQCDYKEEKGLDTSSPPYCPRRHGPLARSACKPACLMRMPGSWTPGRRDSARLFAWPCRTSPTPVRVCTWRGRLHLRVRRPDRRRARASPKVMQAIRRDGLDARREIETVLRNLKQGMGHCFRTVALYLELGGKGRVCVGSVGIAYSFKKRDRVWWLYGNGAKKSAAWVAGTAHAQLAKDEGGAIASNGKFYAYV